MTGTVASHACTVGACLGKLRHSEGNFRPGIEVEGTSQGKENVASLYLPRRHRRLRDASQLSRMWRVKTPGYSSFESPRLSHLEPTNPESGLLIDLSLLPKHHEHNLMCLFNVLKGIQVAITWCQQRPRAWLRFYSLRLSEMASPRITLKALLGGEDVLNRRPSSKDKIITPSCWAPCNLVESRGRPHYPA